jgi:hypothetical protein
MNINNVQQFTTSKNLTMLWDVLLDELHIDIEHKQIIHNIKTVFDGNITLFTARANPNTGLMNLNKQFLNQVLIAVNQLFPNLKQEQQMKRISISNEVLDEPYKVEDIHNARQTDFEKQVINKRNEFDNSINVKKPKPVDFSDKTDNNIKITEMEALIAETVANRKYDIEQIHGTNTNNSLVKGVKKVSFNDNENVTLHIDEFEDNQINTNNIFSKLKKTIIAEPYKDKTEVLDKSESDKTELLDKRFNEMNNKIDTLFTMMQQMSANLQQLIEK